MSFFSDIVHSYWQSQMMRGSIIHIDEVFTLVSNPELKDSYKVMILEMANTHTMAVVTPLIAAELKLEEIEQYSIASLRRAISKCELDLHAPDYIYYLPNNNVPDTREKEEYVIRALSKERDREVFIQFESSCLEEDLDGAYVSLDHWLVYGVFDTDRLVGVSSMYLWDDTQIADLGIIIHNEYRGEGIATRLVQTICREVVTRGYVPQYRCQIDNDASVALAAAVGFKLFGQWEAIVANK